MAEPTLKDVMVSLSDINTNVKSINERLSNLDSSMENVNSRLNKLETLNFKIAQVEDSQEMISKEYESQKVIINEIQRKNKYLEGENDQLHRRMIILEKLIRLDVQKASDIYGLSVRFLKIISKEIAPTLSEMFNESLETFFNHMKIAMITPTFKGVSRLEVSNYRPVSVLPIISKLLEKIMNVRLTKFLENKKII